MATPFPRSRVSTTAAVTAQWATKRIEWKGKREHRSHGRVHLGNEQPSVVTRFVFTNSVL